MQFHELIPDPTGLDRVFTGGALARRPLLDPRSE